MKVLVIDDNLKKLNRISDFRDYGYEALDVGITSAENHALVVRKALSKIRQHPEADVIFLDGFLSDEEPEEGDGYEIASQLGPELCKKVFGTSGSDELNARLLDLGVQHIPGDDPDHIAACLRAFNGNGRCSCEMLRAVHENSASAKAVVALKWLLDSLDEGCPEELREELQELIEMNFMKLEVRELKKMIHKRLEEYDAEQG